MSEIKVNSIKGVAASAAAITVNNSDGTCTANLTNRTNRRLTINGAMTIAQRGVSSTSTGYQTVDRFTASYGGTDEAPTQAQVDVASGTTPYNLGLTKALRVTNGNQTSGAGAADYIEIGHRIEAQDIRNSGWNYLSSSSFITLSFYVKSSVAQVFYGYIRTRDGTAYSYPFSTGSLSADTWTKITKTISGNSNLTFNNDNGDGLNIFIDPFYGTDYTNNSRSLDSWAAHADGSHFPDMTSTWYTTNDATFELTGVQLEVGSVATDFEHRSFAQELTLCQRYYQQYVNPCCTGVIPDNGSKAYSIGLQFQTRMRAAPTLTIVNAGDGQNITDGQNSVNVSSLNAADRNVDGASIYLNLAGDLGDFRPACLGRNDNSTHTATYQFLAEL
tara:strand:- start:1003 stop:2166 length:1164 start_codon:yes stop_codon:yes gene_type:complete